jgi:hypothetical protein
MSLHHQAGDPARVDRDEHPGATALVALARQWAARAPAWPGVTRQGRRRWALVAASDAFEAWIIGWEPGGAIELHDHGGSAGAVAVAAGELLETSVVTHASGEVALRRSPLESGRCISFGGNHVHDIVNVGATPAISVHVYAPRLSSMTYYRMSEGVLEAGATVRYRLGEAVA